MRSDLHTHSIFSDGSCAVEDILDLAKHIGLECVSITDHDTVAGQHIAMQYGAKIGVKVISGIELSASAGVSVHILGYNIDYSSERIREEEKRLISLRRDRKDRILQRLRNMNIILDDSQLPQHNVGRGHIGALMVKEGYVKNINEAFDRYLGENKSAFVPDSRLAPFRAVELIAQIGGKSVIAHPLFHLRSGRLKSLIEGLMPYGLGGIEAYYPTHTAADTKEILSLAKHYGLFVTGGSDFHGVYKETNKLGICTCELPEELH